MSEVDERFVVLRFTDTDRLEKFYELMRESGFTSDLDAVTSDKEKVENKSEGSEAESDGGGGSRWSDWGAENIDENNSEGVNDFRVVQR